MKNKVLHCFIVHLSSLIGAKSVENWKMCSKKLWFPRKCDCLTLYPPLISYWMTDIMIVIMVSVMTSSPQGPNHRIWAQPSRLGPSVTRELLCCEVSGGYQSWYSGWGTSSPSHISIYTCISVMWSNGWPGSWHNATCQLTCPVASTRHSVSQNQNVNRDELRVVYHFMKR